MDPKKIDPKVVEAEVVGESRYFGRRELQVNISQLCVSCFPSPEPAIFVWGGHSLCQKCFTPLRQELDKNKNARVEGIRSRDYAKTWGEEPIQDAEVI